MPARLFWSYRYVLRGRSLDCYAFRTFDADLSFALAQDAPRYGHDRCLRLPAAMTAMSNRAAAHPPQTITNTFHLLSLVVSEACLTSHDHTHRKL